MEQYRPLMANMHVDASSSNIDVKNLSMLCDLELISRLHAILPHFRFHAYFMLFYWRVGGVPTWPLSPFFDPYTKFNDPTFDELKALESLTSKNLSMSSCKDLNGEEANCVIIEFVGAKFSANQHCLATSALKLVLKPYFPLVMPHPTSRCEDSTRALVLELEVKFPNHELMLALGVIYLNF